MIDIDRLLLHDQHLQNPFLIIILRSFGKHGNFIALLHDLWKLGMRTLDLCRSGCLGEINKMRLVVSVHITFTIVTIYWWQFVYFFQPNETRHFCQMFLGEILNFWKIISRGCSYAKSWGFFGPWALPKATSKGNAMRNSLFPMGRGQHIRK